MNVNNELLFVLLGESSPEKQNKLNKPEIKEENIMDGSWMQIQLEEEREVQIENKNFGISQPTWNMRAAVEAKANIVSTSLNEWITNNVDCHLKMKPRPLITHCMVEMPFAINRNLCKLGNVFKNLKAKCPENEARTAINEIEKNLTRILDMIRFVKLTYNDEAEFRRIGLNKKKVLNDEMFNTSTEDESDY